MRLSSGLIWTLLAGVLAAALLLAAWTMSRPSPGNLLKQARVAFVRRDFATAERQAAGIPATTAQADEAALLAADAARQQGRLSDAMAYLERLRDPAGVSNAEVHLRAGTMLNEMHAATAAVQQFQLALKSDPDNLVAHENLSYLLGMTARSWEATPHRLQLIKQGKVEPVLLFLLCMGDTALENMEELTAYKDYAASDPGILLGMARVAVDRQEYEPARKLLQQSLKLDPGMIETHVKLGRLMLRSGSAAAFDAWNGALPAEADEYPEIWIIRGAWAQASNRSDESIRCYWEGVRRDPNHERGTYQLAQLLIARGDAQRAEPFLHRSRLLSEYFDTVKVAYLATNVEAILKAAHGAEALDNLWEASAWYHGLQAKGALANEAAAGLARVLPRLQAMGLTRTAATGNPGTKVDLSAFPLLQSNSGPSPTVASVVASPRAAVSFSDQAAAAGLRFQYFNGVPTARTERHMYEFSGGGTAVLDYDRDGWPDLYLTQGAPWPRNPQQTEYQDRLFRHGGTGYVDITEASRISETGFSQGVTVGDFNNDGFPDLYIANIGLNRFFRNNGDGTFTDVTTETGTAGSDSWSTSCVLADLNQDGWPDLYCVNYLSGNDVFERVCPDAEGRVRSCSPRHFPAAQDQFWMNLGDGRFENVTESSGIVAPDGKGLGIVAADFDGSGKLSLFVANDAVPNFFFVNQSTTPGARPQFAELALESGLALNVDGRPQACMGVACGDADGDGQLDLFVTNFFDEYNTLYRQVGTDLFEDATRSAGLFDTSLKKVGFGTQFIDGELDGQLDLVLVNGDVDDFRDLGRDFAMRPQYLQNRGAGKFVELTEPALGPYFQQKQLGRGMARLDWNRDGREDVAISNLDVPAALLTTTTQQPGHFLTVRVCGVTSSRDAIGTTVTVHVAGRRLVRQLTAGDGYFSSNERMLSFGLGTATTVERVEIRWPSGLRQEFNDLVADTEWLCIEAVNELQPVAH
ncbi:MAG: tetratricopeptide repeat protein [Planctomycetaceae bacterium]|nr:tetratricopeptide repeat protein [Planctomycetaceae bacterium]